MTAPPPEPVRIDDALDPRLAEYFELTDPAARARREGAEFFVAEGVVAIERLLESGHRVRSMLLTEGKYDRLAPLLVHLSAPIYVTPRDVMADTVGFKLHRGAIAAADRKPLPTLDELLPTVPTLAVLEGLNDPENLGALARSARALGIGGLVLDPTCIDPYYRRTVRVSMGEILKMPVARAASWPDDLDVLHAHDFTTWALTPDPRAASLWEIEVPPRVALVLGAEGPGLSPRTIERCSQRVRIPISGAVDSLNVGAAAAIAFAELARRDPNRPHDP